MWTVIDEDNKENLIPAESAAHAALLWGKVIAAASNMKVHQTVTVISENGVERNYIVVLAVEIYEPAKEDIITSVQ